VNWTLETRLGRVNLVVLKNEELFFMMSFKALISKSESLEHQNKN